LIEATELGSNMLSALISFEEGIIAATNGLLRANATSLITNRMEAWASNFRSQHCPAPMGEETDGGKHAPLINHDIATHCNRVAAALAVAACTFGSAQLVREVCAGQRRRSNRGSRLWWYQDALGATTPRVVSLAMLLLILACIFFLAASNFNRFAGTFLNLESQGSTWLESRSSVQVFQIMVYSLFYSIEKLMHDPHTFFLLPYLLAAFSGVLPYTKLFAMLISWLAPAKVMPVSQRGRVLLLMDQIGKWSLLDIFVIQFISGALYTTADVPGEGPELSVALRTNQAIGFTCFVLATVGSLIIGHACVYFHEQDPSVVQRSLQDADAILASQTLCCFSNGDACCAVCDVDAALRCRRRHRRVTSMLLLILALIGCGCALPSFTVELKSPFGTFSQNTYSLFGFASKLPDLAEEPNLFSTRFSQGTFVFFAIITIHAHVALLLFAWLARLSLGRLKQVKRLSHVLLAWSALDVCVVGMVVTLVEMESSDFVSLNDQQRHFIGQITGEPVVSEHGLIVDVTLHSGSYILGFAALLHCCASRIVMNDLERALLAVELHRQRWACSNNLELNRPQSSENAPGTFGDDQDVLGPTAGIHVDKHHGKDEAAAEESSTHV